MLIYHVCECAMQIKMIFVHAKNGVKTKFTGQKLNLTL